ncbi:hypothetical protein [Shewanella waksmanii]|uniref:hypothetical protein n=1 Tax=Shewanella waksmanii TaxID=213783 RepID=UPI003735C648
MSITSVNPIDGSNSNSAGLDNSAIVKKALNSGVAPILKAFSETDEGKKVIMRNSFRDPLDIIKLLLAKYTETQSNIAKNEADDIAMVSAGISEVNKLWSNLMTDAMKSVKPGDVGKTVNISTLSSYSQVDKVLKDKLGLPNGIKELLSGNVNANYDQLQSMQATVTAHCDTVQVDVNSQQQEFKNTMTAINSAKEERANLSAFIIQLSSLR